MPPEPSSAKKRLKNGSGPVSGRPLSKVTTSALRNARTAPPKLRGNVLVCGVSPSACPAPSASARASTAPRPLPLTLRAGAATPASCGWVRLAHDSGMRTVTTTSERKVGRSSRDFNLLLHPRRGPCPLADVSADPGRCATPLGSSGEEFSQVHTAGKGALTRPPRLSTALTRHSPPSGMCAGWQELRPRAPGGGAPLLTSSNRVLRRTMNFRLSTLQGT